MTIGSLWFLPPEGSQENSSCRQTYISCCCMLRAGLSTCGCDNKPATHDANINLAFVHCGRLIAASFNNEKSFQNALNNAFEHFINLSSRAPEYISLFMDDKLRKARLTCVCMHFLPYHMFVMGAVGRHCLRRLATLAHLQCNVSKKIPLSSLCPAHCFCINAALERLL